jgi:FkbM family methyltransferase
MAKGIQPGEALRKRRLDKWKRMRKKKLIAKTIFGIIVPLNPEDLSDISSSISTLGWYNLSTTVLLMSLIRKGMAFIDVGANLGYYTLLASKIVGNDGLVLSYEPEPINFSYLRKATSINKVSNVRLFNQAVLDKEGIAELYLSDIERPEAHSMINVSSKSIAVPCTTIDRIAESLDRKIDFIKLHVSGAELKVLSGAKETIKRNKISKILTVLGSANTCGMVEIIEILQSKYLLYEVLNSPFVIRKTDFGEVLKRKYVEVLLVNKLHM